MVILVLLLIVLAVIPRGVEVFNKNYVFGFDQGRDYLAVKNIVDDYKFTLIGPEIGAGSAGFQYIFHGPGYYYLLTIPYILFHGDPYGGVVLMFLLGVLSIGLAFFVGWKMFGVWEGYLFALLMAISPPLIDQSRFIWNSYPTTPLIILSFYFTYLSIKRPVPFIALAAFLAGFIYNFELAIAAPLTLGLVFFYTFIQRKNKLRSYLWLAVGFFISYLPMVLFEARHGFLGIKSIVGYILSAHPATGQSSIVSFFPDHVNSFKYTFFNAFPKIENPAIYVFLLFIIVVFGIYFVRKEKNEQVKKIITYLLCLPIISFIVFTFLKNTVWQHYLYHLIIIYLVLFAYICISAVKGKMKILYLIMLVLVGVFTIRGIIYANAIATQSFADYYGGTAKMKGKIDAIDYIYKDAKGEKFSLFVFSPAVYTYPYDYLLYWYAAKKYDYVPSQEKKGLIYLLIEKDTSKPWSYEGWIETVIKVGEVEKTTVLTPSDFIIQKRYVQ